jgi:nucleotide-binding universal stress UspA family protein
MSLYERILVPVDGSESSVWVMRHAVDLAAVHDAAVHGLAVVPAGGYAGLPMDASWEGLDDALLADAEEAVTRVRRTAQRADVPVETQVVQGRVGHEIVEYADTAGCDLVVVGYYCRGGIDRLLLGSVAEKVVRSSPVPVLTVRVGSDASPATADAVEDGEPV